MRWFAVLCCLFKTIPFANEDRRYGPLIGFYRAAARQNEEDTQ